MKTRLAYILLLSTFVSTVAFSQSRIVYSYDASGNRISKSTVSTRAAQSRKASITSKADSNIAFMENDQGISIKTLTPTKFNVYVYTLGGILMSSKAEQISYAMISLKELPRGTYIIKVEHDGTTSTYKAVKR